MDSYYGGPRSSRNHFREPPTLIEHLGSRVSRAWNALRRHEPSLGRADVSRHAWGWTWSSIIGRIFALTNILIVLWVIVLYHGERSTMRKSIENCQWDHWESWPRDATPNHLVLIADPQLVDPHTYPGRPWPLSTLTVRYTDLYLRRAYSQLQRTLYPDTVIFLGDLFDGGREWSTAESKSPEEQWRKYGQSYWLREYIRFGDIFFRHWGDGGIATRPGQEGRKLVASIPGNHDLGFGVGIQKAVRKRFNAYFGEGNRIDVLGNHTFVSVDTVSLSAMGADSGNDEELWEPTMEFLEGVQEAKRRAVSRELRVQAGLPPNKPYHHRVSVTPDEMARDVVPHYDEGTTEFPTILLGHVPLYRSPGTPCGPLREHWPPTPPPEGQGEPLEVDERNAIAVQAGYQYQNVLTRDISKDIAEKVGNVQYAFSGDDHDYCEVVHRGYPSAGGGIREITVKSMSWAMGVRKPGFLMVSLWNPVGSTGRPLRSGEGSGKSSTIQTHLCLLPDQLGIFIRYATLFAIAITLLIIRSAIMMLLPSRSTFAGPDSPVLPTSQPASSAKSEKADAYHSSRHESLTDEASPNSSTASGRGRLSARTSAARPRSESPTNGYGHPAAQGRYPAPLYGVPLIAHAGYYGPVEDDLDDGKKGVSVDTRVKRKKRRLRGLALFFAELRWSTWRVAWVVLLWYAWLIWNG